MTYSANAYFLGRMYYMYFNLAFDFEYWVIFREIEDFDPHEGAREIFRNGMIVENGAND